MVNTPIKNGNQIWFKCWTKLEGHHDACPNCGNDLNPTLCKQCGARVKKDDPTCPTCGKKWHVEKPRVDPGVVNYHPYETTLDV